MEPFPSGENNEWSFSYPIPDEAIFPCDVNRLQVGELLM